MKRAPSRTRERGHVRKVQNPRRLPPYPRIQVWSRSSIWCTGRAGEFSAIEVEKGTRWFPLDKMPIGPAWTKLYGENRVTSASRRKPACIWGLGNYPHRLGTWRMFIPFVISACARCSVFHLREGHDKISACFETFLKARFSYCMCLFCVFDVGLESEHCTSMFSQRCVPARLFAGSQLIPLTF